MDKKKRKKIAIILDEMSVGGIPKACISFMNQLVEYCDVTLILCNDQGVLTKSIPQEVNIEVIPYVGAGSVFKSYLRKRKFVALLKTGIQYADAAYIRKRWVKSAALMSSRKAVINKEAFDCAIAYHGMNVSQLVRVLFQVEAKKKIAWIHGDHPFSGVHKKDAASIYASFDKIFCVSEETRKRFLKDFPGVFDITGVYYNFLESENIFCRAKEPVDMIDEISVAKLVTVGRISPEKGQDMMPDVLNILLKKGYQVRWYVVGDGNDRSHVEQLVKEQGLEEYLCFTGMQDNPYPYMLNSDIYVQCSYTEGYPLTIFEAAILGKAIVATDVGGTKEHLSSEEAVFVSCTPESIAEGIERVLTSLDFKRELESNVRKRDFSNRKEILKLLEILDRD